MKISAVRSPEGLSYIIRIDVTCKEMESADMPIEGIDFAYPPTALLALSEMARRLGYPAANDGHEPTCMCDTCCHGGPKEKP
jgi:hypothetical protein